jgi:hypothetical protein
MRRFLAPNATRERVLLVTRHQTHGSDGLGGLDVAYVRLTQVRPEKVHRMQLGGQ